MTRPEDGNPVEGSPENERQYGQSAQQPPRHDMSDADRMIWRDPTAPPAPDVRPGAGHGLTNGVDEETRRLVENLMAHQPGNNRQPARPQTPLATAGIRENAPDRTEKKKRRGAGVVVFVLGVVAVTGGAAGDVAFFNGRHVQGLIHGLNSSAVEHGLKGPSSAPAPTVTVTNAPETNTPTTTPKSTKSKETAPVAPVVPKDEQCVTELPDNILIAQKIMGPVTGSNLATMAPEFKKRHIGGAILMTSPANPADGSILKFKKDQTFGIEIAVDQEGGNPADKTKQWPVSRIKVPVSTLEPKGYMPMADDMAKMDPAKVSAIVEENYSYLKEIGITTSFGTVADVAPVKGVSVLGKDRVPSSSPAVVSKYVVAYVTGAHAAGVTPVAKHFGMGSATANTDKGPAVTSSISALEKRDLLPYLALKFSNMNIGAMVGSEYIPGLTITAGPDKKLGTADDVKTPASLSRAAVTGVFKKTYLQANTVTYTDDLGAAAIVSTKKTVAQASVEAWQAGTDVALFVNTSLKPKSATHMTVPEQLDATIVAGEAALKSGDLNRTETIDSVARLLKARHIGACTILKATAPDAYKALKKPLTKTPAATSTAKPATPNEVPSVTRSAQAVTSTKQATLTKQAAKTTATSK